MTTDPDLQLTERTAIDSLSQLIAERVAHVAAEIAAAADAERERAVSDVLRRADAQRDEAVRQALARGQAERAEAVAEALRQAAVERERAVAEAVAAAAAEREQAVANARAQGEAERDEALAQIRQQAAEREQAIDAAMAAAIDEHEAAMQAALSNAAAERQQAVAEARAQAEAERDEALALLAERESALANAEAAVQSRLDALVREARAEADGEAQRTLENRVAAIRAEADRRLERELEKRTAPIEERLRQAEEQLRVALEEAPVAQAAAYAAALPGTVATSEVEAVVADVRTAERECATACIGRLAAAVRDLDGAASLSQALDRLSEHAAAIVNGRVVTLVVRGTTLRGWKAGGFEPDTLDVAGIEIPIVGRSVVAVAARTGRVMTTRDAEAGSALEPLASVPLPDDQVGFAVPMTVGGRTAAVLYADAGATKEPTLPSAWPDALEIAARHAAGCLERLTVSRAYGLHTTSGARSAAAAPGASAREAVNEEDESAQRYARLLVSEIKLYHEDAVNAGRREGNLLAKLGAEIARARQLYEQRVPAEVRSRADYFGQELVRTLANGDPRLLGLGT